MGGAHSAVIYYHGIGDPRRHVSLGNFLDHFDLYGQRQDKAAAGKPRSFKYQAELFGDDDEVTNFIEFKHIVESGGQPRVKKTVRVYEAYWVPESRSNFSVAKTIVWFFSRFFSPFKVVFSPWRSYPAIRILCLFKMGENYEKKGHLQKLERAYRDFENWENRGKYPRGSFSDFEAYISEMFEENESLRLLAAAALWRKSCQNLVIKYIRKMMSIIIGALALVYSSLLISQGVLLVVYPNVLMNKESSIILIFGICVVIFGLSISAIFVLFKNYLFDIISWTLESERSSQFANRERIIRYSQDLIRKVAAHPGCEGVTIISLSLGSCIATESLLKEGAREKFLLRSGKVTNLHKVKSIFTIGSPLDMIFFFFQADQTFSHRYNRISEEKRPSISLPPFLRGGFVGDAKIYNFWSRFDPISSTMHALRKRISERQDAIINVENLPGPRLSPFEAHTNYFADPNLMASIYASVIGRGGPIDVKEIERFFRESRSVKNSDLRSMIFDVSIFVILLLAALGFASNWLWVMLPTCFFINFLLVRSINRSLAASYQQKFGSFLHRGERGVDVVE